MFGLHLRTPRTDRARPWWGAALVAIATLSCDGGGGPGAAPSLDYAEYRAAYEEALCEWRVACFLEASAEACRASLFIDRGDAYVDAAIAAGTIRYDGEMGYACVEEIRARGCAILSDDEAAAESPTPSCAAVFTGQVAPEDPCMIREECVEDGVCGFDPNCVDMCCPGSCRLLPPPAELGASCVNANVSCVEGAFCSLDPMTGTRTVCVATSPVGSPCGDGNTQCDSDSFCDFETLACVARLQIGEVCYGNASCVSPARCEWTSEEYVEQRCMVPAALGAPCNRLSGSFACEDVGAACTAGTCQAAPGVGDPCPEGRCAPYAFCDDGGTCLAAALEGEACGYASGDYYGAYTPCAGSLRCDNTQRCVPPTSEADVCPVPGMPFEGG